MDRHPTRKTNIETTVSRQSTSSLAHESATLHALLELQRWDGSWAWSSKLANQIPVTTAEARTAVAGLAPFNDKLLATFLVAAYISTKFPDRVNIWRAIVKKTEIYPAKQMDEQTMAAATAVLVTLLANKYIILLQCHFTSILRFFHLVPAFFYHSADNLAFVALHYIYLIFLKSTYNTLCI